MATKAKAPEPKSNLPAAPRVEEEWERKLRERAKDVRAAVVVGIPRITHKGSLLAIDGKKVADKEIRAIILGLVWVKTYYETEYDPKANKGQGSNDPPVCYAFGTQERGLAPHPKSPLKQAEACDACPHNKFNTAGRGRGKRCSDRPRLLVILADDLAKDGEELVQRAIAKAPHYQLEIPPASIKNLGAYTASLADLTPHGDMSEAITRITTGPRESGGHEILFEFMDKVPHTAMRQLFERSEKSFDLVAQPFPVQGEKEDEAPVKAVKGQGKR